MRKKHFVENKKVSEGSERTLLAACINSKEAYFKITEKIKIAHLGIPAHQTIYEVLQNIVNSGLEISLESVEPLLSTNKEALSCFRDILNQEFKPENIDQAIIIVSDRYQMRYLIQIINNFDDNLNNNELSSAEILNNLNLQIEKLGETTVSTQFTIAETLRELIPDPENVKPVKDEILGVPSGIRKMDMALSGAEPGDLIYIGGLPSSGKTELALQWTIHAAKQNEPVMIFSLETDRARLVNRLLTHITKIDGEDIKLRRIIDGQKRRWLKGYKKLEQLPIILDENPIHTPASIANAIRRQQHISKVSLVVIDYIQLIADSHEDLKQVTRQFQNYAKSLNIPIIVISQLKRVEVRDWTTAPKMSDFRESSSIEASATKMITITSEPLEEDIDQEEIDSVRSFIWIIKNKDGRKTRIPVINHLNIATFNPCRMFTKESIKKKDDSKKNQGNKRNKFIE